MIPAFPRYWQRKELEYSALMWDLVSETVDSTHAPIDAKVAPMEAVDAVAQLVESKPPQKSL